MFSEIKDYLLDLFFPIECLGCGQPKIWLCPKCFDQILLNYQFNCPICGSYSFLGRTCFGCQKKFSLTGVWVASNYKQELLKQLIYNFKYNNVINLGGYLGEILINYLKLKILSAQPEILNFDLIIPVPLHPKRLIWRGFNQAEILSNHLSKEFGWPVVSEILKRDKNTLPQVELKQDLRAKNIKGAFLLVAAELIKNKKILLVDDIFTTGATIQEAAKILFKAGAREVWGLVVAKG